MGLSEIDPRWRELRTRLRDVLYSDTAPESVPAEVVDLATSLLPALVRWLEAAARQ